MREDTFTSTVEAAAAYEAGRGAGWDDDRPSRSELEEDAYWDEIERNRRVDAANAERNRLAAEKAAEREAAGLIRWVVGRENDPRFHEDMRQEDLAAMGNCPACGKPMTYCWGHSQYGAPQQWRVLQAHRHDQHDRCHPDGCPARKAALDS